MAMRVLGAPFWLLWRGYLMLWWAFDDSAERSERRLATQTTAAFDPGAIGMVTQAPSAQQKAFEIGDSGWNAPTLSMPRPDGLLRGGFAGAMAASGLLGLMSVLLTASDAIGPGRALVLWFWLSGAVALASVLAVRRVARRRFERPRGPIGRMRDACAGGFHRLRRDAGRLGARVSEGVRQAWSRGRAVQAAEASQVSQTTASDAQQASIPRMVPAIARGARGVLDPLLGRARAAARRFGGEPRTPTG